MIHFFQEVFDVVAEVAEVKEDIGNCEEFIKREFILFILRP